MASRRRLATCPTAQIHGDGLAVRHEGGLASRRRLATCPTAQIHGDGLAVRHEGGLATRRRLATCPTAQIHGNGLAVRHEGGLATRRRLATCPTGADFGSFTAFDGRGSRVNGGLANPGWDALCRRYGAGCAGCAARNGGTQAKRPAPRGAASACGGWTTRRLSRLGTGGLRRKGAFCRLGWLVKARRVCQRRRWLKLLSLRRRRGRRQSQAQIGSRRVYGHGGGRLERAKGKRL